MGGAMDSCGRFMKFSLICINVVTFVGAVVTLGVGAWVWSERAFPSGLLSNDMLTASVAVVMVTAAAGTLLSVLGCCGAAREVKCMLLTYYILMFIMFVAMLVGGILLLVFREKLSSSIHRELSAAVPLYGVRDSATQAWDSTQSLLQCCGVRSFRDWNDYLPDSCCRELYPGTRLDCKTSPNVTTLYMDGCADAVLRLLRESALYVAATAVSLALVMLLGLILSCGLFVKIE